MIRIKKVRTNGTIPKRHGLGRVGVTALGGNLLRIRTCLRSHFFEENGAGTAVLVECVGWIKSRKISVGRNLVIPGSLLSCFAQIR